MLGNVNAVLLDMDGVVHVGEAAIPGAAEAVADLEARNIPYRFLTNTTTRSRDSLHRKLTRLGITVRPEHIITTHQVAARYLESQGLPSCCLLVDDDALDAYGDIGIEIDDRRPRCVVVGDIGRRWNYDLLNRVFNMLMDGASLVALHKGRYWRTDAGLQMDIGAFVAGLEYTAGVTATVLGKPEPAFFNLALSDIGVHAAEAIMVGDDIESDVGGAQRAGVRGILVKTGKYREDKVMQSDVSPDAIVDSIADLNGLL